MRIASDSRVYLALVASITIFGCGSQSGPGASNGTVEKRHHEHDGHDHSPGEHSHTGPHRGHLIELGNEAYHAELLHDDKLHRVTVYILDGKAQTNVPISQPELLVNMIAGGKSQQFKLVAVSQENEQRDMASCFQIESEELCEALDDHDAKGRLVVNVNGKQYSGNIEHHDHEDRDHDHKADHEHK